MTDYVAAVEGYIGNQSVSYAQHAAAASAQAYLGVHWLAIIIAFVGIILLIFSGKLGKLIGLIGIILLVVGLLALAGYNVLSVI